METWTKQLPLQEFPAKVLLCGVGITNKPQTQVDAKTHRVEPHKDPPTAYAGRQSPSVCARCIWTLSSRIESAPSGKHQATTEIIHRECCCLSRTALDLPRFLFCKAEAASAAKRDDTPLRLLSWLSFRLEPAVEKFIEDTMLHLSTVEEVNAWCIL